MNQDPTHPTGAPTPLTRTFGTADFLRLTLNKLIDRLSRLGYDLQAVSPNKSLKLWWPGLNRTTGGIGIVVDDIGIMFLTPWGTTSHLIKFEDDLTKEDLARLLQVPDIESEPIDPDRLVDTPNKQLVAPLRLAAWITEIESVVSRPLDTPKETGLSFQAHFDASDPANEHGRQSILDDWHEAFA